MSKELKLIRNNDEKNWEDLEWINEFYQFLQGECPEEIRMGRGNQPKLSEKKAFGIIWYLQEHLPVLPDNIERCSICGTLYDDWESGWSSEKTGKHYCDTCLPPEYYEDENSEATQ